MLICLHTSLWCLNNIFHEWRVDGPKIFGGAISLWCTILPSWSVGNLSYWSHSREDTSVPLRAFMNTISAHVICFKYVSSSFPSLYLFRLSIRFDRSFFLATLNSSTVRSSPFSRSRESFSFLRLHAFWTVFGQLLRNSCVQSLAVAFFLQVPKH